MVTSRSMKFCWGFFAYEAVLVLTLMLSLFAINSSISSVYTQSTIFHYLTYIFPILGAAQLCIVALFMPIITSSSISGEIERQTYDILMTTCMSPFSIVMGKVASVMMQILLYVVGSIPIMSISFIIGGMSWWTLLLYLITVIGFAFFSGSMGVMCSALFRKSILAVIMSFVIYVLLFLATFIPLIISEVISYEVTGASALPLLFNPVMFFVDFFVMVMTGQSIFQEFDASDFGTFSYLLMGDGRFVFTSAIVQMIMALGFIMIAAHCINPLRRKEKIKKRK